MVKHKLLLADDSITIQKVVNLTFADEGVEVISVGDGNAAMKKLSELTPDLVMADINMPGLSGYEICERIRANAATRHIPVILLVGSFEPFDEEEARRVGASDFLTKPFQSIRQLVTKVSGLLDSAAESAKSSTDAIISDLEATETQAVSDEFEDTLKMQKQAAAAAEEFGDSGMDDEMIQTNQVGSYGLDETQKFQSHTEAANEEDFGKTQPLSSVELNEISSYQNSGQTLSETDVSENQSETAAEDSVSASEERGYVFVGDAPYSVPTPVAEESFPMVETEMPSSENQYYNQNEYSYQSPKTEVSTAADTVSTLEFEEDGNLLELPPQENLSAAAFSQPVWQEDVASHDDSIEPNDETSATNQFAVSNETPETVSDEVAEENQPESNFDAPETVEETLKNTIKDGFSEKLTAVLPDENQAESVETERGISTATNFSPEVIAAIAAKVSERFSDRVIREIVAEITPQITELIAKRIAEENSRE